jgi:autotransporter-associated beta strand protein
MPESLKFTSLAALLPILLASSAGAQTVLTWGSNGVGQPAGGTGDWALSGPASWTSDDGATYENWPAFGIASQAVFGGNSGTVTITEDVSASVLNFVSDGYLIDHTAGTLTLTDNFGFNPKIIVESAGHSATIRAPLAGDSGLLVLGDGTLNLAGANTLTGNLFLSSGGSLRLKGATANLPSGGFISFGYDGSSSAGGGGTFILDNSGATAACSIPPSAIFLFTGESTIMSNRAAGHDLALNLIYSPEARRPGATANFIVSGGSNGTTNKIDYDAPTGFIDQGHFFAGGDYLWSDAGGFVRAINYGSDPGTATSPGGVSISPAAHLQLTGSVTSQTSATVSTLKFSASPDLGIESGHTLNITGGILKTGGGTSTISGGALLAGNDGMDLVVRVEQPGDSLAIHSPIEESTGRSITKSGAGKLTLTAANSFSGNDDGFGNPVFSVFLNQGTLSVATLPVASEFSPIGTGGLFLGGGILEYTGSSVITTRLIEVKGGGAEISVTQPAATLTLNSAVYGLDGSSFNLLKKSGPGTLALRGNQDNSGLSALVSAGTLLLEKSSAIFTHAIGHLTVQSGATARLAGTGDDQIYDLAPVTIMAGGVFDTNGRSETFEALKGGGSVTNQGGAASALFINCQSTGTATFSGVLSDGAGTLAIHKQGDGTQIFTGANTYTGGTTVARGILSITQPTLADSSTVTISSGAILNLAFSGNDVVRKLVINGVEQPAGIYTAEGNPGPGSEISALTGIGSLTVVANPPASDYDLWAAATGAVGGIDADDDGDGLSNRREYAFGLLPTSGSSANPITIPLSRTAGTFSFTRRTLALTGLAYRVRFSTDLLSWNLDSGAAQSVTATEGDIETVQVTLSPTLLAHPKLFVRVEAD